MSDRRGPLDFYAPLDEGALPRSRAVRPVEAPGFVETIGAGYRTAQADRTGDDEQAVIDAYGPVVTALRDRGMAVSRYVAVGRGAGRPVNETAVWQDIAAIRASDPEAFADLPAGRDQWRETVLRRYRESVLRDADTVDRGGAVAGFLGGVAGQFTDPVNLGLMFVGGGGATVARRIATEALANAGTELVQQPLIAAQRQRTGRELTLEEGAANVAMAGVAGGAFAGAGAAARAGLDRWRRRTPDGALADQVRAAIPAERMTAAERAAVRTLERTDETLATSPFRSGPGSDAHLRRMDAATTALERGETLPRPAATPAFDFRAYANRAAVVESGGKWDAQAKTSSAYGQWQITRPTWMAYAKKVPSLADLSEENAWARRTNPAAQEAVFRALTTDNRAALARIGARESHGNLYLMHFAGNGGASKILRAAPDTPIEELLPARAVAANPFLKGMKAGEVVDWAHRRMGEDSPDAPVLSREGFEPDDAGDAEWRAAQAEADAAGRALADADRQSAAIEARMGDDDPLPGFDDAFAPPPRDADPFAPVVRSDEVSATAEPAGRGWDVDDSLPPAPGNRFAAEALSLERAGAGEIPAALSHPDIGTIDVKWGEAGDAAKNWRGGFGLAHILAKHPEIRDQLADLPDLIRDMAVVKDDGRTIRLASPTHEAGVRLDWDGEAQRWLVTAYEKGRNAPAAPVSSRDAAVGRASPDRGADNDMAPAATRDNPGTGDAGSAPIAGFDHPDDVAAARQIDSLEHDLRMFLEEEGGQGLTVRLSDEGDVVNAADALDDLDMDDAAIDAAQACMRVPGGDA